MSTTLEQMYIGDSRAITINVVDDTGEAIDITGKTLIFTVASEKQGIPAIELTNTEHVTPLEGKSVFQILSTHTESLTAGNYHFDVVLVGDATFNFTIAIGTIKFVERVSIN